MNRGQFKKGNVPYNKGMKCGSRSPSTEFKKGRTPFNFKGIGTPCVVGERREVVATTDEVVEAISRGRAYHKKKRTSYARYLWQKEVGPIPAGMVVYNNGDRENILIENLELISRAELIKRNLQQNNK